MSNQWEYLQALSVDEYLRLEEESAVRHEYVAGHVYPVAGTTIRHNRIIMNIYSGLRAAEKRSPCRTYSIDIMVRAGDRVYYPDGVVTCGPHDQSSLIIDQPCFVVEVASRNARRIDRGEKLDAYRSVESMRGILIVEQERKLVTSFTRRPDGTWDRADLANAGQITVPCPQTTLTLDEIYEGAELPPLAVGETTEDYEWAVEADRG